MKPSDQSSSQEDSPNAEALRASYGAERGIWTEPMLITLHERRVRGNRWFSLADKVFANRTIEIAWSKVAANAGAAGVDGVNIAHFSNQSDSRLLAVKERLREGSYQPSAIKRVNIPKPGSAETRPLGIPTVRDRVVQSALAMVVGPIFEREFCDNSFGFRPGRGCKDALREVERHLRSGLVHVLDIDIKGYFDAIPHDRLMDLVKRRISDRKVLALIEAFLKQPVQEKDGQLVIPDKGTPQGGVVSPLLANLYLDPLDWFLQELGLESVRYADDIIVLADSETTARHALEEISKWMGEAELTLHPEKTRIVDMSVARAHFDYLGYRFQRSLKGKLTKLARPQSEKKLRDQIRPLTKRSHGNSLPHLIERINEILRGWYSYFKQANKGQFIRLDGWVRMKLRSIVRRRHGRKGRANLRESLMCPNRYFEELGLFSLERAKAEEMSLQKRATC